MDSVCTPHNYVDLELHLGFLGNLASYVNTEFAKVQLFCQPLRQDLRIERLVPWFYGDFVFQYKNKRGFSSFTSLQTRKQDKIM